MNEVFMKEDFDQPNPPYRSPCGYALHFALKGTRRHFNEGDLPADMVRFLLEMGAWAGVKDDQGNPPLEVAERVGESDIVNVFEGHEAKINPFVV